MAGREWCGLQYHTKWSAGLLRRYHLSKDIETFQESAWQREQHVPRPGGRSVPAEREAAARLEGSERRREEGQRGCGDQATSGHLGLFYRMTG